MAAASLASSSAAAAPPRHHLALLLLISLQLPPPAYAGVSPDDRAALWELYQLTSGASWKRNALSDTYTKS